MRARLRVVLVCTFGWRAPVDLRSDELHCVAEPERVESRAYSQRWRGHKPAIRHLCLAAVAIMTACNDAVRCAQAAQPRQFEKAQCTMQHASHPVPR
jgi:hypothetical protein